MREIEIKARVSDEQALLKMLTKKKIILSEPVKQHDVVYSITGTKDNSPGSIWLRIRTENDSRCIFTLKQQHTGGLDSIEHETVVENEAELVSILNTLGYSLYSDLTKTRRTAHIDSYELCLDEVADLGMYVELEKLVDESADGDTVRTELWQTLQSLGISRGDEVFEGYDVLHRKATGVSNQL